MDEEHVCHCTCPMQNHTTGHCDGCGKRLITGIPSCTYCREIHNHYEEWFSSQQPREQIPHITSAAREAFPIVCAPNVRLHYLCERCHNASYELMAFLQEWEKDREPWKDPPR